MSDCLSDSLFHSIDHHPLVPVILTSPPPALPHAAFNRTFLAVTSSPEPSSTTPVLIDFYQSTTLPPRPWSSLWSNPEAYQL